MPLFGEDPKDVAIKLLTEERDHLRVRVADLEKQLMAVTNPGAYRLIHREPSPAERPAAPAKVDPYTARASVYVPDKTLAEIKALGEES